MHTQRKYWLFGLVESFQHEATELQFRYNTYLVERSSFMLVTAVGCMGFAIYFLYTSVSGANIGAGFMVYFVFASLWSLSCCLSCMVLPRLDIDLPRLTLLYEGLVASLCSVAAPTAFVAVRLSYACLTNSDTDEPHTAGARRADSVD